MQISKWGNSLAVRLPVSLVREMNLSAGDKIELRADDNQVFYLKKVEARDDVISKLRKFRGKLPENFIFDREEANVR